MNLLDLVPSLERQLRQYRKASDTDSMLAAYLADAVEAMGYRWTRTYEVEVTAPMTFEVEPTIVAADKRPIILMASIIYKTGNLDFASFRDGDFAYDPQQGNRNPLANDIAELNQIVGIPSKRLAQGIAAPLFGYAVIWNRESYGYLLGL